MDEMCLGCDLPCEYADRFFTPPQTPAAQGFFLDLANRGVDSPTTTSAPASQSANYTETPHYPHAPPSTPITALQPDQPVQLWSSEVYKATINFLPSELPEHLRDGGWCQMPIYSEFAVLFGPQAAITFDWTQSGATQVQAPNDSDIQVSNIPVPQFVTSATAKFFWGPPHLLSRPNTEGPLPSVESQVCGKTGSIHEINADHPRSSLDSEELVPHSNEVDA